MKAFVNKVVRFWLIFAISCGIFVSADVEYIKYKRRQPGRTHERVSFLNFSDEPIQIFWIDERTEKPLPGAIIDPFKTYTARTYSAHTFLYSWGGPHIKSVVEQTSENYADDTEYDPDMKAQVHVLGDMDIQDPEFKKEFDKMVDEKKIYPKPSVRRVFCSTTQGDIRINVMPSWAPRGAARFLELIDDKYYDGCALNRVIRTIMTQFGIGADYSKRVKVRNMTIPDDPMFVPPIKFKPGYLSFTGSGENSRTGELFMASESLDILEFGKENSWETPFGYVDHRFIRVLDVKIYSYGDVPPHGEGPDPNKIYESDGYEYLEREYPEMDYIKACAILPFEDNYDMDLMKLSFEGIERYILTRERFWENADFFEEDPDFDFNKEMKNEEKMLEAESANDEL